MKQLDYALFETELGWSSFLSSNDKIVTLSFGLKRQEQAFRRVVDFASDNSMELADSLPDQHPATLKIQRYAAGEKETFRGVRASLDHLTEFQRRVVNVVRRIKYGETLSYGEVADRAGAPRAARAVGTVMRKNRVPLIVPCHRVIASGGAIGGYSAADGVSMKQRLLALEAHIETP